MIDSLRGSDVWKKSLRWRTNGEMNMDVTICALVLHAAVDMELDESRVDLLIMESKCAEFFATMYLVS